MHDGQNHTFDPNSEFMKYSLITIVPVLLCCFSSCKKEMNTPTQGSFAYDVEYIRKYTKQFIELSDTVGQAKVLLSADYQGRVMTSSASGYEGTSFGWLNYGLISSGEKKQQFNPVGGEERFWLGPEGGQYSLYFHAGDSFAIKNWQVPPVIDTESFDVEESTQTSATFSKQTTITNYSGTKFDIHIERKISLLDKNELQSALGTAWADEIKFVAYQTNNQVKNIGSTDWTKEGGLLSIWLLGMFTPTEQTTVIIPFKSSPNAKELITTNYFGEIPAERISILDSVLFFTCDGKLRSKIGLSPIIAKPISASYDFQKNVLTITKFEIKAETSYVNSKWEIQQEPYLGDAVNSYNDGPLADGSQLGPFYELESSSAALELKAGEASSYKQITAHFEGDFEKLNALSINILGIDLTQIKK